MKSARAVHTAISSTRMNEALLCWEPIPAGSSGHDAGRRLLERMFFEHTGQPLPEIIRTPRGKPRFSDSPLCFSISHTPRHVFCALGETNLGIDAEEMDRTLNLELAEKVLSPEEYAQFQAARDQRQALLRFWVLKEAQAKLTGAGLTGYPRHTRFSLDDPRVHMIGGCFVAVLQEDPHAF